VTVDKELKRKITARWYILAGAVWAGSQEAAAFAQLEYILIEAGLLARQRKRRKNLSGGVDGAVSEQGSPLTVKRDVITPPAQSNIDDNTMSLSEEVGRNYGE